MFPLPIPHEERTDPCQFIPDCEDRHGAGERMWRIMSMLRITQGKLAGKTLGEVAPPWQEKWIRTLYGTTEDNGSRTYDEAFLLIAKKQGKALEVDSQVFTPSGFKRFGDLQPGEYVFGLNGKPTEIKYVTEHRYDRDCYRITLSDGRSCVVDGEHEWLTSTRKERDSHKRTGASLFSVKTTAEIADTVSTGHQCGERNHQMPRQPVIQLSLIHISEPTRLC